MTFRLENVEQCDVLQATGDWAAMLSFCVQWVKQEPTNYLAWQGVGDAQVALGDISDAITNYTLGIEYAPSNLIEAHGKTYSAASLWYRIGHAYQKLQITSQAIDAFLKAIAIDPRSGTLWNDLAVVHMNARPMNTTAAFEALKTALACEPKGLNILSNLGLLYAIVDRQDGVQHVHKSLLAIDEAEAARFLASAREIERGRGDASPAEA